MKTLVRTDLLSLEQYAVQRDAFRRDVLEHKKNRSLAIGPHLRLLFEDRLTIQYQVQEMLRVERIFEAAAIDEELAAYVPLIPDGSNLKATMLIEYPDVEQRRAQLGRLAGIEKSVWLQVEGFERVYAIADEDMDRTDAEKTSAVHFLRFELTAPMIRALTTNAGLAAGAAHENYRHQVARVDSEIVASLRGDLVDS